MIKKIIGSVVIFILICFNAYGFDDGQTHPELTANAIANSKLSNFLTQYLGLPLGDETQFTKTANTTVTSKSVKEWLKAGSKEEDAPLGRAANHFHNPLKPWDQSQCTDSAIQNIYTFLTGWTPLYSNITWATGYKSPTEKANMDNAYNPYLDPPAPNNWDNARIYYYKALTRTAPLGANGRETAFAQTFQALGQVMHLLEDMAVPAHVRNDFKSHLTFGFSPWYWPYNPFEYYVKHNGQLVSSVTANLPSFTRLTDFWDTNQYESASTNPSNIANPGLAEYTNANFVSEKSIYSVDEFPYPRVETLISNPSVSVIDYPIPDPLNPGTTVNRPYYKKVADGETGYRLAGTDFFRFYRQVYLDDPDMQLFVTKISPPMDDFVYQEYAEKLLPRAVGYSAGLLNYFFRGQMEAVNPETVSNSFGNIDGVKLKVKNSTPGEEMNAGKFVISYQYKPAGSDQLTMGVSREVYLTGTIASGSESASEFSFDFSSSIPSDAQEVKYWLVYKGKLGNEQDAVIGKIFDVKNVKEYVFLVSTAPYGKKPNGNRIKITALMPFEMNVQNNSYSLKPANTFSLPGEMYFDSTYTTSLVINSNEEKNYHKVYYTMDDEEFNLRWSASLRNYGCTVIGYWSEQYPPTGSTNPSCWAYLKPEYSSSWASGRRTNNISYRGYKGYLLGHYYNSGGNTSLNDVGKDWQQPWGIEHTEGSPYTVRHTVIARTGNKAIYIKRDANNIWETKEFPCPIQTISTWNFFRWKWTGQQTLYFGDIIIKTLDYYGAKWWGSNPTGQVPYWCTEVSQFANEAEQEYIVHYPGGGSSISEINTDRIIDIMDYDNYNDDELFVLFYSIRDHRTSGYPIDYYLTYKIDGNVVEVPIFSGVQGKDRIYGVSSQLNNDSIVYSYYVQHSNAPSYPLIWTPEKYVVGIINITDGHLGQGHRQEFEYHPLAEGSSPSNLVVSPSLSGNLSPGTYTYYVAAVNPINQTLASAPVNVTISSEQKGVVLNWSAVEGATHYIVYGRSGNPVALTLMGNTTWTDSGSNSEMGSDPSNPWTLPSTPIKPFLSAIGVHKAIVSGGH